MAQKAVVQAPIALALTTTGQAIGTGSTIAAGYERADALLFNNTTSNDAYASISMTNGSATVPVATNLKVPANAGNTLRTLLPAGWYYTGALASVASALNLTIFPLQRTVPAAQ